MKKKLFGISVTFIIICAFVAVNVFITPNFQTYSPPLPKPTEAQSTAAETTNQVISETTVPSEGILNEQQIHIGDTITYSFEIMLSEYAEVVQGILHYDSSILTINSIDFPGLSREGGDFISDTSKENQIRFSAIYLNPTTAETTSPEETDETTFEYETEPNTDPFSTNIEETTVFIPNGYDFTTATLVINAVFDVTEIPLGQISLHMEITELSAYGGKIYVTNSEEVIDFAHSSDFSATAVKHPIGETQPQTSAETTEETTQMPTTAYETTRPTVKEKAQTVLELIERYPVSPGPIFSALIILAFLCVSATVMLIIYKKVNK